MKVLLVNIEDVRKNYPVESFTGPIEAITNKELLSANMADYVSKFDKIYMFFNKDNINFYSLATFIQLNDRYVHHFVVVIDASEFDEEDNNTLDVVIETLSDYVQCLITDSGEDIDEFVKALISKYNGS